MTYGTANFAKYREMEVLSLSPERRLVLLYTHLLSNLRQAQAAGAAARPPADRVARLMKAHAILEELRFTLDMAQGGTIAVALAGLYDLFMDEVLRAVRTPNADRLAKVIANVTELHEAFAGAAETLENTGASLPAAASA